MLSFDDMRVWQFLVWLFGGLFNGWLLWSLFVVAPRQVKDWELRLAWKKYFQDNVAHGWTFYDGLGG